MNTNAFGPLAAVVAALAVALCVLAVTLQLPTPAEILMIVGAIAMLAVAGGLIGISIARQKKAGAPGARQDDRA